MYIIILSSIIILIILIITIWIAYSVSAAYQQTLSLNLKFNDTFRYYNTTFFKLDSIRVKITGKINDKGLITNSTLFNNLLLNEIINHHSNTLITHEYNIFTSPNSIYKKIIGLPIEPSVENLSIYYFNLLEPLIKNIGCQLLSVSVSSNNLTAKDSRYKINNYTIN